MFSLTKKEEGISQRLMSQRSPRVTSPRSPRFEKINIINVPKSNEIWNWSNPNQVRKMADKYLGKNIPVYLSTKNEKKYMVETPEGKLVHFGQLYAQDYTYHKNEDRRNSYLARSGGILGDWKNNKYSPNNLSRNLLW